MVYRFITFIALTFVLFSCGEISNGTKSNEIVLELDSSNVIQAGSVKLLPILNKKNETQLLLKIDSQEGDKLELEFDIDLKLNEKLHYSINNGGIQISASNEMKIDLLEGNNVIFVCLTNAVGMCSSYWVKNYFVGQGSGDFDANATHLFQNISSTNEGLVVDYFISSTKSNQHTALLQLDTTEIILTPGVSYFTKSGKAIRLQLINQENGDVVNGPFNDSGVIAIN